MAAMLWRCSEDSCGAECPAGEQCVAQRCRRPCSSQAECDSGTVCFKGYCEIGDPLPGDPLPGDPNPGGDQSEPAVCSDNVRSGTEACDGSDLAGKATCDAHGYTGTEPVTCAVTCRLFDLSPCTGPPGTCNGAKVNPNEQCDGADLAEQTCETLGFSSGTLNCNVNCSFALSACVP